MSFGIYMVGFIILIVGLGLGAHLMHVPPQWIGVGVICMVGLAILLGVTSTKRRDPS
jgi:protein-S-isoprenylcysteine O-methyltransferase Ste14